MSPGIQVVHPVTSLMHSRDPHCGSRDLINTLLGSNCGSRDLFNTLPGSKFWIPWLTECTPKIQIADPTTYLIHSWDPTCGSHDFFYWSRWSKLWIPWFIESTPGIHIADPVTYWTHSRDPNCGSHVLMYSWDPHCGSRDLFKLSRSKLRVPWLYSNHSWDQNFVDPMTSLRHSCDPYCVSHDLLNTPSVSKLWITQLIEYTPWIQIGIPRLIKCTPVTQMLDPMR
jgi:hypothetical protein